MLTICRPYQVFSTETVFEHSVVDMVIKLCLHSAFQNSGRQTKYNSSTRTARRNSSFYLFINFFFGSR